MVVYQNFEEQKMSQVQSDGENGVVETEVGLVNDGTAAMEVGVE